MWGWTFDSLRKDTMKIHQVGFEVIHPEAHRAASRIVKILRERHRSCLLAAECQQGKTNVAICVIDMNLGEAKKQKKTLHVIFIVADAKNSLRDQTLLRMTRDWDPDTGKQIGADLGEAFHRASSNVNNRYAYVLTVVHRSELRKVELHPTDWRLVILDECHIGEIVPGTKEKIDGEINRFFARAGINLSKGPQDWKEGRTLNHLLAISATGYSWLAADRELATMQTVALERSSLYTGLPEVNEAGRFNSLEQPPMLNAGAIFIPSPHFLKTIRSRFHKECRLHGGGYGMIRLQGQMLQDFLLWCRDNDYPFRVATIASGEIDEIQKILDTPVKRPTFLIISGIFRAGMTIKNDANIRLVIETTALSGSGGVDSITQGLLGRSCGYGKTNPYPIFCNMKKVEESIRHILEMRSRLAVTALQIPRSKHLREVRGERCTYIRHETNPLPGKNSRKQSRNKMNFGEMILSGSVRTAHGEEVFFIDQMTTADGKPLPSSMAPGYYIRSDKSPARMGAVLKAETPFTSSRVH